MARTYSAPDIYNRIKGGYGSSVISKYGQISSGQARLQSQINQQVNELSNKMNAAWQGKAADQAVSGAGPMATASDSASTSLDQAATAMNNQVSAFDTAYNNVVPMASAAPQNNPINEFVSAFGITTPLDNQISQYNAAGQHNVQVYNNYSNASSANAAAMPTDYGTLPEPHPTITVAPPSGSPTGGGATYAGAMMPSSATGSGSTGYRPPSGGAGYTNANWASAGPRSNGFTAPSGANGPGSGWSEAASPSVGPTQLAGYTQAEPNMGFGPGSSQAGFPSMPGEQGTMGGWAGPGGGLGTDEFGGPNSGRFGSGSAESLGAGGPTADASTTSGPAGSSGADEVMARGGFPGGAPGTSGAQGMAPMAEAGRGRQGDEDTLHQTPDYLLEADPDAIFGSDRMTVPPVLGG